MFYYIKGKLVLNEESQAVIDAGGVAYALTVSANTQAAISSKSFNGESEITLFTHLSVREDGVELFGFNGKDELHMFKLLNKISRCSFYNFCSLFHLIFDFFIICKHTVSG